MLNSEPRFPYSFSKNARRKYIKKKKNTRELNRTTPFTPCVQVRSTESDIKRRQKVQILKETQDTMTDYSTKLELKIFRKENSSIVVIGNEMFILWQLPHLRLK